MLRRLFARLFGERGDVTEEDRERLGALEEEKRRMAQGGPAAHARRRRVRLGTLLGDPR